MMGIYVAKNIVHQFLLKIIIIAEKMLDYSSRFEIIRWILSPFKNVSLFKIEMILNQDNKL